MGISAARPAGLDRYARNAFRVLGLGVGATVEAIDREAARRRALLAIERPLPDPAEWFLGPLAVGPADVEEAARKLRDPVSRFEEGLFWVRGEPSPSPGDAHDEAVLAHAGALRATASRVAGTDPAATMDASLLTRCDELWQQVAGGDDCWRAVEERAFALGDPRLDATYLRSVRRGLLDQVRGDFARLVVDAYRRGGAPALPGIEAWFASAASAPVLAGFVSSNLGRELDASIERAIQAVQKEMAAIQADYRTRTTELTARWVDAYNDFVPALPVVQLFTVTLNVMGDGVTILDSRDVFVNVPPEIFQPPLR